MEALKIILLCILSAVAYGIVHDQVTARVCVKYFTIGHPPVFDSDSPTVLAFGWGILATWWVGLLLGVPAALAARAGPWHRLGAADLVQPILCLVLAMGSISLLAGMAGYVIASAGGVRLIEPMASRVPAEKHTLFLADLWAHLAAYGVGFVGGLVICLRIVLRRRRMGRRHVA